MDAYLLAPPAPPAPPAPNITVQAFVEAFARTKLHPIQGDYFQKSTCGACALTALVFDGWSRGRTGSELGEALLNQPRGIGLLVEDALQEWYSWSKLQIEAFVDGYDGDRYRHKAPPPWYRTWHSYGKAVYKAVAASDPAAA